jgi:hypothetical protein
MVLWVSVGCTFCALVVNFLISSFQFLVEQYTPMLNSGNIDVGAWSAGCMDNSVEGSNWKRNSRTLCL